MNISTIILGTEETKIQDLIRDLINIPNFKFEKNPDFLLITLLKDKKSIGIEEVRGVSNFLSIKPLSFTKKIVMIQNAETLTPPAQNSLLKILEEPAEYSQIFLVAQSLNTILPTIISRCRVLNAKNKNEVTQEKEEFLSMNISEKFILAEALSKKEKTEVISYLNQILFEIKNSNLDFSKESIYFFIETQEKISKYNLNIRLALENLFLNFEIPEKKV
jgi:DNA polymerase III delta prime subunit